MDTTGAMFSKTCKLTELVTLFHNSDKNISIDIGISNNEKNTR